MSSEHPSTPGSSAQGEVNSTQRSLPADRPYDPRILIVISAILVPAAAISISYTLLRRHIADLRRELIVLRNADASLAREVREWKTRQTVAAAANPPAQPTQTSDVLHQERLAVILPQLDTLAGSLKTTKDRLESRIEVETQRIRDLILSEAVAAARREGMTHAWQAQTSKRIALLMADSSGTESKRTGTQDRPNWVAMRKSLLAVAALLKDVDKGQDVVLLDALRWERMHMLAKQLDASLKTARRCGENGPKTVTHDISASKQLFIVND
ncbi:hypothetical protein C8Q80DRAFT_536402 [Daedaleopsis nitida]|nr:hypothetical protein C8Q80DRAFT_536402 [Daedaleopsis nitida]